jgi:hypothetical protein
LLKANLQAKHILSGTKIARCDGYHISSVGRSFPPHEPVPGNRATFNRSSMHWAKLGQMGKAEAIISRVIEQAGCPLKKLTVATDQLGGACHC